MEDSSAESDFNCRDLVQGTSEKYIFSMWLRNNFHVILLKELLPLFEETV